MKVDVHIDKRPEDVYIWILKTLGRSLNRNYKKLEGYEVEFEGKTKQRIDKIIKNQQIDILTYSDKSRVRTSYKIYPDGDMTILELNEESKGRGYAGLYYLVFSLPILSWRRRSQLNARLNMLKKDIEED